MLQLGTLGLLPSLRAKPELTDPISLVHLSFLLMEGAQEPVGRQRMGVGVPPISSLGRRKLRAAQTLRRSLRSA